jgi:hypothetical protein
MILLYCLSDNKIWILDNSQCRGKNHINIGVTKKAEYYKYQYDKDTVINKLHIEYALSNKFIKDLCLIPQTANQKVEHLYRTRREKELPYLLFRYPDVQGLRTDYYINEYKIQEKVAFPRKDSKETYIVSLHRNNGTGNVYKCYEKGDNDFYWAWIKDTEDFYIFPETCLVEKEYIQVDNNLNNKKQLFNIRNKNWTKDYKYNLKDINLKEKLFKLFKM